MADEKMEFNREEVVQTIRFCNFLEFLEKEEKVDRNVRSEVSYVLNKCRTLLGYMIPRQIVKKDGGN